jgi:hypothetical protein
VVAILLAPFLTYEDLSPAATPALWSLAVKGAIGSMNTVTADPGWPTVAGGALSLSAGRWAAAVATGPADANSLPAQRAANGGSLSKPELAALGEALNSAGGRAVAIGVSDPGNAADIVPLRPAELVATDSRGHVDVVIGDTLSAYPDAPFGVRSDTVRLTSAIASALADIASAPNPGGLLVVDPGDLARIHLAASRPDADATQLAWARTHALASLDSAAATLAEQLPPDSLLLVVTPTTDKPYYEPPYFGPIIAYGRGLTGSLTSASTHRAGLVTNLDVAPTVLESLGVPVPPSMIGQSFSAMPNDRPLAERITSLSRTNASVGAIDKLRDRFFTPAFAWLAILCVGIAVLAAFRPWKRLGTLARALLLVVLSAVPAAWLALLAARYPTSASAAALAFGIAWLMTSIASILIARQTRPEAALFGLAAATALLIMLDQWLGGPLQTGLFSYSVRAGWRYYGIGNEGSALAVGAALAALGLACDHTAQSRWAAPMRRYAIPMVGGVALVTAAAPFAGANAGVAVWGTVAFAVAWLRVNRIPFSVRTIVWTAAVVVLVVGGLVAVELLGSGSGTHIGRFFAEIGQGGSGALELVRRKALNNVGYVTRTPYSFLALTIAAGLALERFAAPRPLARALSAYPGFSGALAGVIAGSIVATLTEDSGVVMPALMLLAGALPGLYLAICRDAAE